MPRKKSKKKSGKKMPFLIWGLLLLFVAIPIDTIDFFFSWVPVFGTLWDIIGTAVAFAIAGPMGLIYIWEVVAFGTLGNIADGFVPTLTILMLAMYFLGKVQQPPMKKNLKR